MRFLLSFLMDPAHPPSTQLNDKCFSEMMAFISELEEAGQLVFDSQVMSQPSAVRLTASRSSVDESHPSSSFVLGGFFVVSATDAVEAKALARRCPHLQVGPVEVRVLNETEENAYGA